MPLVLEVAQRNHTCTLGPVRCMAAYFCCGVGTHMGQLKRLGPTLDFCLRGGLRPHFQTVSHIPSLTLYPVIGCTHLDIESPCISTTWPMRSYSCVSPSLCPPGWQNTQSIPHLIALRCGILPSACERSSPIHATALCACGYTTGPLCQRKNPRDADARPALRTNGWTGSFCSHTLNPMCVLCYA